MSENQQFILQLPFKFKIIDKVTGQSAEEIYRLPHAVSCDGLVVSWDEGGGWEVDLEQDRWEIMLILPQQDISLWNSEDMREHSGCYTTIGDLYFTNISMTPEQWNISYNGNDVGYIRIYGGGIIVECPDCDGDRVLDATVSNKDIHQDCLPDDEREAYLNLAAVKINKWLAEKNMLRPIPEYISVFEKNAEGKPLPLKLSTTPWGEKKVDLSGKPDSLSASERLEKYNLQFNVGMSCTCKACMARRRLERVSTTKTDFGDIPDRMIRCEFCASNSCPHADDHNNTCTMTG